MEVSAIMSDAKRAVVLAVVGTAVCGRVFMATSLIWKFADFASFLQAELVTKMKRNEAKWTNPRILETDSFL